MKSLIFLLAIIIGSYVSPNVEKGTIKGTVTDATTGKPIPSAFITVLKDGNFVKSSKTDTDGKYTVCEIVPGTYSVKVVHNNYEKDEKKSIAVTAGSETTVNFSLKATAVKPVENLVVDVDEAEEVYNVSYSRTEGRKMKCDYAGGMVSPAGSYDNYQQIDWNTEEYDKINENIFKDVMNNPLSTFSVDVDRAAYANVRRFLQGNQKPYKDAVRIEEMINYFDYDYPQPTNGDPFSINVEMGDCPWNTSHTLLHIGLQGENLKNEDIPDNNLVFLIDVSGSMGSANKLPLLKQAFKILVDNLRDNDRVAIVVYAGAAGEVLPSTPGNEKQKIIASLDQLESGGSTAGGAGIKLAYQIAKQNYIPGGNNRVILATDGDFNVGPSSDGEMERLIEQKRKEGVFLTILGFGMGN
ncbi:MAG: von Willebrand factor type A domain-containing protein, partial [Bacteroidota bacterium]